MADPLSVASGVAGLVSLTIQATQLACKYVAEVSEAGETALQCLRSLSLLRDVLARIHETEQSEAVAAIVTRKSDLIPPSDLEKCTHNVERVRQRLQTLFHDDGKVKRRKALAWPFQSAESAKLIKQLQDFRDTLASVTAADSLEISAKSHAVATNTQKDVGAIKATIESGLQDEEARRLLTWISADDTEHGRLGSSATAPVGNASFFFDSVEFRDWQSSSGGILWTHGAPGSGKSVLMSQAISHLQQHGSKVLSHFCDHRDPRTQSPELFVRDLIKQAALHSVAVLKDLQTCPEYVNAKRSGRNLRKEEAERMLLEVCLPKNQFMIILDGLDECSEQLDGSEARQHLIRFLNLAAKDARVLVASRHLADIETGLCCTQLTVRAPEDNLREYVVERLAGLEKRMPLAAGLTPAVVDKVVKDADGIFLLARLAMDILAPIGIKNLRQIKKFLAQKSLDLSEMYQATYSRIRSSDTTTADLARRVILWICYAQRPLHEVEVQHAIATELEDEDFDPDGITPGDLLRSSCMGLVICDGEGIYSLFHLTAYEFFRSNSDMNSDASHLLISRACLTYLSFSGTGRQGPCEDLATLEARKSEFRLLDYAAKHSANHIRQVEAALLEEVSSFLHDDTLRQALMQAFYHRHRDDEDLRRITFETLPSGFSPLQIACGRGLMLTAQRMLQEGEDPKAPDAQGWTPLISATSYGQLDLINLLLSHAKSHAKIISKPATNVVEVSYNEDSNDRKDDIVGLHQPDNDGWTPLFWAIIKDQYQAAEQLLTAGSKINVRDEAGWTPIEWAAFRGNRDFVDLILRFTPSDGDGLKGPRRYRRKPYHPDAFSPLFMAAAAGDHQSMEAMLKFGFNIPTDTEQNLKNMFKVLGKIPPSLRHYMRGYSSTSAPSLIRCDDFTVNLLESAIRLDQQIIVKMLVELGVPLGVMKSEIKQRTPLHVAAVCGRHQICEYLLIEGASPSLPDANGFTAMDLAIMVGHPQCTRLFLTLSPLPSALMERGASLTAFVFGLEDAGSGTLKSSTPACGEKNWCDLQMVNRRMPMADVLTPNLASDVQQAGTTEDSFGFEDVVDILQGLLDNGCDPGTINQYWDENKWALQQQTALHHACSILNQHLISFLIVDGADVNTRDATGESPLYKACSHNAPCSEEIVRTLLQHGADPNALDNHGHSILCNACEYASAEVVQCLVTHGAVVKAHGDSNCHPLHFACKRDAHRPIIAADTVKIIDYIVSFSDSEILSAEDRPNESPPSTPLYLAIRANNWEAVVHLRTLGAEIKDPSCMSPYLWEHAADARGKPFRLLLDLGAPISGKCALYGSGQGEKPIVVHYFDKCLHYNVLLDSGRFEATLDDGFEENLEALLEAGADINARSYYFAYSATSDATVLRAARDIGLDDSSMQILLRHGAIEDEELEGE